MLAKWHCFANTQAIFSDIEQWFHYRMINIHFSTTQATLLMAVVVHNSQYKVHCTEICTHYTVLNAICRMKKINMAMSYARHLGGYQTETLLNIWPCRISAENSLPKYCSFWFTAQPWVLVCSVVETSFYLWSYHCPFWWVIPKEWVKWSAKKYIDFIQSIDWSIDQLIDRYVILRLVLQYGLPTIS